MTPTKEQHEKASRARVACQHSRHDCCTECIAQALADEAEPLMARIAELEGDLDGALTQRDMTWQRALRESHLTYAGVHVDALAKANLKCKDCATLIALLKPLKGTYSKFVSLEKQLAAARAEAESLRAEVTKARAATLLEAERAVLAPWDDLGDRPSSPPAALYGACDRIRALAPRPNPPPQKEESPWTCSDCDGIHEPKLGGIRVGHPCPRTSPEKQSPAPDGSTRSE